MLIATTIFFLGNNHVLPAALRTLPVLVSPIFLVLVYCLSPAQAPSEATNRPSWQWS
jgi:hypothetical protein